MAEMFALRFNKYLHKTTNQVSADEEALYYVDVSNETLKTAMMKKFDIHLANIKQDLKDQKTYLDKKLSDLEDMMLKQFRIVEGHIKEIHEKLESIKKKQEVSETSPSKAAIGAAETKRKFVSPNHAGRQVKFPNPNLPNLKFEGP